MGTTKLAQVGAGRTSGLGAACRAADISDIINKRLNHSKTIKKAKYLIILMIQGCPRLRLVPD